MHLPGRFLPTAMCRHQPPFLYRNERNGHLEGGHQDGPRSPCSGLLCVLLMAASCSARRKLSESGFIFLLVYLEVHFLFIGNSTGGARTAIFHWVPLPPVTRNGRLSYGYRAYGLWFCVRAPRPQPTVKAACSVSIWKLAISRHR